MVGAPGERQGWCWRQNGPHGVGKRERRGTDRLCHQINVLYAFVLHFVLYENIVYIYIHKDTYILKPQKPGGAKFDL